MTYLELTNELKAHQLHRVLDALRAAVEFEAEELRGKQGWTRALRKRCMDDAEEFYAEDVTRWLDGEQPQDELQPEDVLFYRRKATAWAVATLLREARERVSRGVTG